MNQEILHTLIDRYEEKIDKLYNKENYELFKWQATKTWQEEWNKPDEAFASFADRFTAARKDFDVFIDGKIMHPSTGVIKLWQKDPAEVERLFREVLFSDDQGDVDQTQRKMDRFVEEYELLRSHYFPRHFSYKQDRHSASVFLAVNNPEKDFVYRSSDAGMMARYTEFGFSIGTGGSFSLRNYYRLCEEIIEALREHRTLLDKHFSYFNDSLYRDESLHLLAFDLIYCCRTYNYYAGLPMPLSVKKSSVRKTTQGPTADELEMMRAALLEEKTAKLGELEAKMEEIEAQCDDLFIPLINVEVVSREHGIGTVVEQTENNVVVQYPGKSVRMILGRVPKTSKRPQFENDDDVWTSFSEYASGKDKLKRLVPERTAIMAEIDALSNDGWKEIVIKRSNA